MPRRSRAPALHAPVVLGLWLACLNPGCGRPFAEGGSREVTVITEWPGDAPEILLLRAILEREAVRIENEPAYVVRVASPRDARAFRSRNVILAGAGPAGSIPARARALARALGPATPFVVTTDLWGRGQAAGLVWTGRREEWIREVAAVQNRLFHALDRSVYATVRARVASLPRDHAAEARLLDSLGIRMRLPRGYSLRLDVASRSAFLVDDGPPARLIRIQLGAPGPGADLREARAALARRFRPEERTLPIEEPSLGPRELMGALRQVNGRWQDEGAAAAGPFRVYAVERRGRRWLVDLAVFAPGRPKLPHLRELMAIAESVEDAG